MKESASNKFLEKKIGRNILNAIFALTGFEGAVEAVEAPLEDALLCNGQITTKF